MLHSRNCNEDGSVFSVYFYRVIHTHLEIFLTAICLPHVQLWAIIQGKAPWPTLGHHRGGSLTKPMLVTAFCVF